MVLDDVKILLNIDIADTSKDSILNIFLRIAKLKIKHYLNTIETLEDIENNYSDAITMYIVELYRARKVKSNVVSESQGARSTTYKVNVDIPDNVKSILPMPCITLL